VKERVEDAYGELVIETVEEGRVSYTSLPAQE